MAKNPKTTGKQPREKAGASVVGWLLLGLVVIFGGLYVAAHYVAGDQVPRNTTVSGGHDRACRGGALGRLRGIRRRGRRR